MSNVIPIGQAAPETLENVEAEATLLSAMMFDNDIIPGIAAQVAAEDFHEQVHGIAFAAMVSENQAGRAVNPLLLKSYFTDSEALKALGGMAYFAKLSGDASGLLSADDIASQIHDLALRRRLRDNLTRALKNATDLTSPLHEAVDFDLEEIKADTRGGLPKVYDAFDYDETEIPVRPWLVPGAVLAGYTHMLAAPGGSGKSLFTLQLAMAMADGMHWGGFKPRRRYRSLIINVEDDIDEQRRRISGARRVMDCKHNLNGWIHIVDASESIVVARTGERTNSVVSTPIVDALRRYIQDNKIEVVFVDPFAETFEGDENDNSQVKWAMRIWRDDIARATGCAVYLVHHTTKHAQNGAGDANVIRGAGAIVNSTRISATLMPMTPEDAAVVGIDPAERHLYVRYDDAKANQSLKSGTARWFRKESIELNNAIPDCPADIVGALVPWIPPDAFDGLSGHMIGVILDKIERGLDSGERYTATTKGGTKASGKWAGCVITDIAGMSEAMAAKVIKTWLSTGVLLEDTYHCPVSRRDKTGLFAPDNTRPGMPI